jgi:hypothetical protein
VTLVIQGSSPLTISGNVPNPLYPGAPPQSFSVTITNPNPFSVHVTSDGVTAAPPNPTACLQSWFQVSLPTVPSGGLAIAAHSSATVMASAQMIDSNTNQDACQGKQLTLSYTGTYGK